MSKVNDIRSGLAVRALRLALKRNASTAWVPLISFLMPKSFRGDPRIRVSRRSLRRIVRDASPRRVEALVSQLEATAPKSAWVSAFAAEYGLWRGDWALAERYLERCVSQLRTLGTPAPQRYVALLVSFQIEGGRFDEARRTLAAHVSDGNQTSANPFEREMDLLAAGAGFTDENLWLLHVNGFLAASALGPIELDAPGGGGTKFSRLQSAAKASSARAAETKVTVIVSCFNAEEYLETSLRSLLEQSHTNLEIIAVDDSSADGTWELLNAIARREKRVRLMKNVRNVGTYVSRNRALRASTGDYVTTQDSDDWSHPDRIARQLSLLEDNPGAIASYCAGLRMWSDGRFEVHRDGRVVRDLCYPSLMYDKKAILGLTGYWDCVRVEADAEYLRRVLRLRGPTSVVGCPEPMMIQLRRENSLTTLPETRNVRGLSFGDRRTYRDEAARFVKTMQADTARYDFEAWFRPFPAPAAIVVPDELVREAASWK